MSDDDSTDETEFEETIYQSQSQQPRSKVMALAGNIDPFVQ